MFARSVSFHLKLLLFVGIVPPAIVRILPKEPAPSVAEVMRRHVDASRTAG